MPTYSYVCKKCEHAFDVQQSITAAALIECPKCQGEIRKVYSNVGVTFKGSGFYINDSAKPTKSSDS
jgi:putative FmdB family regulatory protein